MLEQHRDTLKALFPVPDPAHLYRPHRSRQIGGAALGLLLVAGLGGLYAVDPGWQQHDYQTVIGQRRNVLLADGSRIQLDADSHLQVRSHLRSRRAVLVSGRARFDVAPSRWRRFQVDAGPVQVRNYGTVFDVERRGDRSEVRLWRGKVGVRVAGRDGEQDLQPGQQLLAGTGPVQLPQPIATGSGEWTQGRLQFAQAPLGEVVRSLQRYHHGAIVLDEPGLATLQVSGVFDGDHAATALALLPEILPVAVHVRGDGSVHISARH
nr:FecR domain-containing protein [Stenotrophomonas indicatrix]